MKKKILIMCIIGTTLFGVTGCTNKSEQISEKINELCKQDQVTQKEYDDIVKEYDSLTDKQKNQVENYSDLEKYEGVDLEEVNDINDKIAKIGDDTKFNDIIELYDKYNELKSKEQDLIDSDLLEKRMELTDLEKATVSACQYVKQSLKSSDSFKLQSAEAVDDLDGVTAYYLVKLKYSGTNSFGAAKDGDSFQTISDDFTNKWYGLGLITGNVNEALNCYSTYITQWSDLSDKKVEMDCDKIMYYIDEDVN